MKLKLTPKLFILVASVLVLQFLIIFLFGSTMVEQMYINDKKNELLGYFKQARDSYDPEKTIANQTSFYLWTHEIYNQNISITIWNEMGTIPHSTSLFFRDYTRYTLFPNLSSQLTFKTDEFDSILAGSEFKYIMEDLYFQIQSGKLISINTTGQEQMYLLGTNGEKTYFLLETALEPIQAAAGLASRSSMIGGIIAMCFGLIITAIVAYYIAKPIRQMTKVAGNLSDLDFSEKVKTKSRDEVGELGQSINRMSESLQRYIDDLNAANDQLKKDIEEQLRAEQAQKQLVSNISHELKTPLALISGYAEGLREGMAEEPVTRDEYCDVILDESRRMTRLLHQLLGLARLQSGLGAFRPEPFNISELADDMASGFSLPASQRHITIERSIEKDLIIYAEPDACEQVLRNYLSNAMKHVPDDGKVSVLLHRSEQDRVRLEVYNSGSHIPSEALDRVWDSFFRVDEGRNRDSGEVGLGLSIVKAHMTRHSMPFGVYNTDDGVVFFAEFPECRE